VAADLTPKQAAFVQEYLLDLNATQAAIRAGYSAKTADVAGPRLLGNVRIAGEVQAALEARAERTQITADRVLAELAAIAFSDLRDVATWGADSLALIDSSELTEDAAHALREVVAITTQTEHGTSTRLGVKSHDKLKALDMIGKHLGMFREKLDIHHTGGLTLTALARMVEPEAESKPELEG